MTAGLPMVRIINRLLAIYVYSGCNWNDKNRKHEDVFLFDDEIERANRFARKNADIRKNSLDMIDCEDC